MSIKTLYLLTLLICNFSFFLLIYFMLTRMIVLPYVDEKVINIGVIYMLLLKITISGRVGGRTTEHPPFKQCIWMDSTAYSQTRRYSTVMASLNRNLR